MKLFFNEQNNNILSFFNKENIFIKNINNKYKLVFFKKKENFVGEVKYYPSDSKE
jgi:hypothetical protein